MKKANTKPSLVSVTTFRVRFSEVDMLRVVWHGEYVRYFEDGREAFGREYAGLGYMDIYESGYTAPIVEMDLQFKQPLRVNDTARVETRYINTLAAKIRFEYVITRESDGEVVATGSSVQAFLNGDGVLELTTPAFYEAWKKRWNVK